MSWWGCVEEEDEEGRNDTFCTSLGRDDQIATSAKLLDIVYESYGFSDDLIETIN